jgi:serine/threonine-protein kinase
MAIATGTVIDNRYELLGLVGEGGFGSVYRIRDRENQKLGALKLMSPLPGKDHDLRARFLREAAIETALRHPNIVEVWRAGIDVTLDLPYYVMELLEGVDLREHVTRRGPLSLSELLDLFEAVTSAMQVAHAQGIVHRDLKPANLFLAKGPEGVDVVKVLDFGVAKLVTAQGTKNSVVIGTPSFMAPEQYGVGDIGPTTDVWAMGLIAFFALTGHEYWIHANGGVFLPLQLSAEILNGAQREPASVRAARFGCRSWQAHATFDDWFARCTALDAQERFADATSALASLKDIVARSSPARVPSVVPPFSTKVWSADALDVTTLEPSAPLEVRIPTMGVASRPICFQVTIASEGHEARIPRRCPVTGASEGIDAMPVDHWTISLFGVRRRRHMMWFSADGYAQHLEAIGSIRRFIYDVYALLLCVPVVGGVFRFFWTVGFAWWMLLLVRILKGPPGLVRWSPPRNMLAGPQTTIDVVHRSWVEEFASENELLRPELKEQGRS